MDSVRKSFVCVSLLHRHRLINGFAAVNGAMSERIRFADRETTGHLLPVAIELWHEDGSPDGKTAVYTPANSHEKARPHSNAPGSLPTEKDAYMTMLHAIETDVTHMVQAAPEMPVIAYKQKLCVFCSSQLVFLQTGKSAFI